MSKIFGITAVMLITQAWAAGSADHWAYRPLISPPVPAVKHSEWAHTAIDRFVLARLEARHLSAAAPADARKLARRIYFDLTGLPPSPEEVERFATEYAANRAAAVERLVDQLLASPHYGERWGRHWLDLARYADSDGQESDADRPTAYHFRDFVVQALNDGMPFDRFVRWQLAGDELAPDNPLAAAATGFLVAGTHADLSNVPMEEEKIRTRFNELDDMLTTTGVALMGATLGCARCHDHKYDPIPRRDYYRLLCAFNSGDRAELPLVPAEEARRSREALASWKSKLESVKKELDEWLANARKKYQKEIRAELIDALKISAEDKALLKTEPESEKAKELAKKFEKDLKCDAKDSKSLGPLLRPLLSGEEREKWDALVVTVKNSEAGRPKDLPTAFGFADAGAKPRETWLLGRGDYRAKDEPVEIGFLSALTRGKSPAEFWGEARAQYPRPDSTQQRAALALWMTDLEHGAGALVARVIVNRVWQHHFGEGLVRTVNDFGTRADPPSHPELLEWLANEFVKSGWRLKPLHRLIMTSAVYLQDAACDPQKVKADPENRLLSYRRPQRVEAEVLRDSILAVSGTLNPKMFGPAVKAPIVAEAIQARNMKDPYPKDLKDTPATRRRSIYIFHKRVVQQPLMQAFDGPDAQASCGRREHTTVAPQALALLNDRFIRTRAEDFARRVEQSAGSEIEAQVRCAWLLAFSRSPSSTEVESSVAFLNSQAKQRSTGAASPDLKRLALTDFCQTIFAMNEFIYVD